MSGWSGGPAASRCRAAANCTGSRICRLQYSGSIRSAGHQSPVRLDSSGSAGSVTRQPAAALANSVSTGSTAGEWNACRTGSSTLACLASASRCRSRVTASTGPETTHRSSPLIAASDSSPSSQPDSWSGPSPTASIRPSGSRATSRPRTTASRAASGSAQTPATAAAAYSPKLWPSNAAGVTPQPCHSRARAYSTANNAEWDSTGSSMAPAPSHSTGSSGWPRCGSSSDTHSSSAARKSGSRSYSPAATPYRAEPWPGKRKATWGGAVTAGCSGAARRSASASSPPVATSSTRRYGSAARPTARV